MLLSERRHNNVISSLSDCLVGFSPAVVAANLSKLFVCETPGFSFVIREAVCVLDMDC